jgi:hypothetical protein
LRSNEFYFVVLLNVEASNLAVVSADEGNVTVAAE